jgi:uncharacterized delta-60 repeat protein
MRYRFLVLTLTTFFLTDFGQFQLYSQVKQEWVSTYSGIIAGGEDRANDVIVDDGGNVYVTGESPVSGISLDYATIKYNSSGAELWAKRYNGPGNSFDAATSVVLDKSGNVYVTGFSMGTGTNYDYATIKYNSAGVQEWVQRQNGLMNGDDRPSSLVIDVSGNVYVTGYCVNSSTGRRDYTTLKYNSSGILQWLRNYNGPGDSDDEATSIAVDDIGNIYVTGGSASNGSFNYDIVTVKYNSSGILQWVQRYDGPISDRDYATSIGIDSLRNVYVAGPSKQSGVDFDYAVIKYNSSGIQQWLEIFDGQASSDDYVTSMAVDDSGNAYVTGYSIKNGMNYDYTTIRYNSLGVQQWVQTYNGSGNGVDVARSISFDNIGSVYVTGYSSNGANSDFATIKYNFSGVLDWIKLYNGPANLSDVANSIFC